MLQAKNTGESLHSSLFEKFDCSALHITKKQLFPKNNKIIL
jgi:hypothetical protein